MFIVRYKGCNSEIKRECPSMIENSLLVNRQLDTKKAAPLYSYGVLLSLMCSFVIGFWPLLEKLFMRWNSDDSNYCYLVVPLFLYLCWEKSRHFKFFEFSWSPWGLAGYALAMFLIVVGELGSTETLAYIGLWFVWLSTGIWLYGFRLRKLWFEFLILAFAVPLPPFLINTLTAHLKLLATSFSVKMLRLVDISVLQEGNIIDLGMQQLQVVDACSGLRYILSMFLLALLLGHFYAKGRIRHALLMLFVLPVAIVVNSFRIFATGVLSVNGHPELAENFFHDFAGFALFLCAGLLLLGIILVLNKMGPKAVESQPWIDRGKDSRRSTFAGASLALYCLLLLGSGWGLHKLPTTQTIPDRLSFHNFPLEIDGWQGRREYLSKDILDELWSDDYVKITFSRPDRPGQNIFLFIPYYGYQATRHTAHAPQSCLLGSGWMLSETQDRGVKINDAKTINMRTMLLQKGKSNLVAGYFFMGRGRVVVSPWLNKFYLLWDAMSQRRTDGALVRVEMVVADNRIDQAKYQDLDNFIVKLWTILPPYIPA